MARSMARERRVADMTDRLRFLGSWLTHPRQTAAIAPSSQELAGAMLAEMPPDASRVIELGGGTGAMTSHLVERGIEGGALMVVEINPLLHQRLRARFPGARVVLGDAAELPRLAEDCGFAQEGPADAVISSLGLLAMDRAMQTTVLGAAFTCLATQGRFVQFTYGPVAPVQDRVLADLGLSVRRGALVLRNMPPATVWVFQRSRAKAIPPRSVR